MSKNGWNGENQVQVDPRRCEKLNFNRSTILEAVLGGVAEGKKKRYGKNQDGNVKN